MGSIPSSCDWYIWDTRCEPGQRWASRHGGPYVQRRAQLVHARANLNPGGSEPGCTSPLEALDVALWLAPHPKPTLQTRTLPPAQMDTSLTRRTDPSEVLPPAGRRGGPEEAQREPTSLCLLPQHSAPLPRGPPTFYSVLPVRSKNQSRACCRLPGHTSSISDETAPGGDTHTGSCIRPSFAHRKTSGRAASSGARAPCGPGSRGAGSPHLGPRSAAVQDGTRLTFPTRLAFPRPSPR